MFRHGGLNTNRVQTRVHCQASQQGFATHRQHDSHSTLKTFPAKFRIRQVTMADAPAVGELCAEAFGLEYPDAPESELLEKLKTRFADILKSDMQKTMQQQLDKKQLARIEHREYRLLRQAQTLRAQLAILKGLPHTSFVTTEGPRDRNSVRKWRRNRSYVTLLAEHVDTNQPAGCVTLCMAQPEALLPSPFPTAAPLRVYVGNMAVGKAFRRQGLALRLLQDCMRLGSAWQADSVWLHVHPSNIGAQALYQAAGFTQKDEGLGILTSWREMLMYKTLPPRTVHRHSNSDDGGSCGSSSSGSSTHGSSLDSAAVPNIVFGSTEASGRGELHSHPLDEDLPSFATSVYQETTKCQASASSCGSYADVGGGGGGHEALQGSGVSGDLMPGQPEQVGGITQSDGVFLWTAEVSSKDVT